MGKPSPATHIRLSRSLPGTVTTHAQLPDKAWEQPPGNRRFNYTFPNLVPGETYQVEVCVCFGENDRAPGLALVVVDHTTVPLPGNVSSTRRAYDDIGGSGGRGRRADLLVDVAACRAMQEVNRAGEQQRQRRQWLWWWRRWWW